MHSTYNFVYNIALLHVSDIFNIMQYLVKIYINKCKLDSCLVIES